jgi:5-methylthioribose kinase
MKDKELIKYLVKKGLLDNVSATITPLTGGVSCQILLIDDGKKRFVLKRALEKLNVKDDWFADIKRNIIEQDYLKYVGEILSHAVPKILYADEEHCFFCMEMLENGLENWKTQLLSHQLEPNYGIQAGKILGTIHSKSANNKELAKKFDTLDNFQELRIEPYLLKTGERNPDILQYFIAEANRLAAQKQCLVHGDYSPKNILVSPDRLVVLDCEVAWYGDPLFDVAFLLNHFMLKGLAAPEYSERFMQLAKEALAAYKSKAGKLVTKVFDERLTHLLLMLMLARVDGKSPVEYLNNEQQEVVRGFVYENLPHTHKSFEELTNKWLKVNTAIL